MGGFWGSVELRSPRDRVIGGEPEHNPRSDGRKAGVGVPHKGSGGQKLELRVREKILGFLRFGCGGAKKVGGVGGGGGWPYVSCFGPWGLGV